MRILFLLFINAFLPFCSYGQISIHLRKTFIDSFKNKLTIDASYGIYYAHKQPNAASKDGDLHFSGWDNKIGLPVVAEVMNAKEQTEAVNYIHQNEGKGEPQNKVKLSGVWRLWCEHPGDNEDFIQGATNIPIENTNPPHVFEIHPATKIGNIDLLNSLHDIKGFTYKQTEDAFSRYSNLRCKLAKKGKFVSIETNGIGYNYVEFWLKLNNNSKQVVNDGLFVLCSIYSEKPEEDEEGGDLVSHKFRVGFVKGSDVYNKVKDMKKGEFLHVAGIPRFNLNLVSWRIEHSIQRPEVLQWNLPFEIVAVADLQ
jgi:hypothetical protein